MFVCLVADCEIDEQNIRMTINDRDLEQQKFDSWLGGSSKNKRKRKIAKFNRITTVQFFFECMHN